MSDDCLQFDNSIVVDEGTGLLKVNVREDGGLLNTPALYADYFQDAATYTPDLYVNGVTVTTIGNGTFGGLWTQRGDTVFFHSYFILGATTLFGATGNLGAKLPITPGVTLGASDSSGYEHFAISGVVHLWDNSAVTEVTYGMVGTKVTSSGIYLAEARSLAGGALTHAVPWSWATSDVIAFTGSYRTT